MKVIDLLNKIANGEEVPEKIKLENTIFIWDKERKDYIHKIDDWCSETLLFKVMNCHFIKEILDTKVELIEEDSINIDNINAYKLMEAPYMADCLRGNQFNEFTDLLKQSELEIVEKINKLVDKVKQLNRELKELEEKA